MIGTQIGRYRIDGELGRGGMGVVFRGTQITLDRTVAIKMLPAHLADGDNQARFRREALTLAWPLIVLAGAASTGLSVASSVVEARSSA